MGTNDDDPVGDALEHALLATGRTIAWWSRRPGLILAITALSATGWLLGAVGVAVLLAVAIVVAVVWRWRWPASWQRRITDRRATRARVEAYRRDWPEVCDALGLTTQRDGERRVPALARVETTKYLDRLRVEMLKGQTPERWQDQAEALAHALGAQWVTVRAERPGVVALECVQADPLLDPIPALPPTDAVNLAAVPVGCREDGEAWTVPVLGSHALIVGATGSGKGSVLWSLLRSLAPGIRDGVVDVWALDPKGGMELTFGAPLFARFARTGIEEMAELLEDAAELTQARAARLAGTTRLHEPTTTEPLVVVLVDELAFLTAYAGDRKLRDRINSALSLVLTQGRAVGVSVVAAVQDPRKEAVGFRHLFTTRIALRLNEPSEVDMVLGDGARRRGARSDEIAQALPGVAYVLEDGQREPQRVRAAYPADADIAATVTAYRRPEEIDVPPATNETSEVPQ